MESSVNLQLSRGTFDTERSFYSLEKQLCLKMLILLVHQKIDILNIFYYKFSEL